MVLAALFAGAPAASVTQSDGAPRLRSATYWGGSLDDSAIVARAPDGSVYVAGTTNSRDLRADRPRGSLGGRSAVYVTKLSEDAQRVRWSTYIGGRGVDSLADVTVDAGGNVLLVGSTNSPDFPLEGTASAALQGDKDAFVTKLSGSGEIVFSTLHGGTEGDHATAVATDAAGAVYVHGYTFAEDFPTTPGALKEDTTAESQDATLVKLTPSGEVVYSTRLGGEAGGELGQDVAVDAAGSAYVSGWTDSEDFPTAAAAQDEYGGAYDAYVAKVDPAGAALEFSTFLGGVDLEGGGFLAQTGDGVAVALTTYSRELAATGFQQRSGGDRDAYVALFSFDGALEETSYLGGRRAEDVTGIAAGSDALYVVGSTASGDFPLRHAFQRRFGGRSTHNPYMAEAFVTKVATDLSTVTWSSFFGGGRDDGAAAVAVTDGGVWVAGTTYSRDLGVRRALDPTWNGASDGWLARVVEYGPG